MSRRIQGSRPHRTKEKTAGRVSAEKREGERRERALGSATLYVEGAAATAEGVKAGDQTVTVRSQNEIKVEGSYRSHELASAATVGPNLVCACTHCLGREKSADIRIVDVDRATRDVAASIEAEAAVPPA